MGREDFISPPRVLVFVPIEEIGSPISEVRMTALPQRGLPSKALSLYIGIILLFLQCR